MDTDETETVTTGLATALESLRSPGLSRAQRFPEELLTFLGVASSGQLALVKEQVRRRLIAEADELDPKLGATFVIVLGLGHNAPTSAGARIRQAAISRPLACSDQTIRRDFKEACRQVSERLAARSSRASLPESDYAFVWARTSIDLRHDRPVIANQRMISVRSEGLSHIDERIRLSAYDGKILKLRAAEGCEAVDTTCVGKGLWSLRLRFPRPLRRGERHVFTISFELPGRESLEPVAGFLPHTTSYDASVELRFGATRPVVIERFCTPPPVEQLAVRIPGAELISPVEARHVFTFEQMRLGYCHGVRWHWDGPPAEELTIS